MDATRKLSTEILPDVLVTVANYTFFMHKSRLVDKSVYMRELIQEHSDEGNALCAFTLDAFPGGAHTFQILAKFFYGEELELTSSTVIPVICAAHYLNMTSDNRSRDIILQAERFLAGTVFPNWKECIEALISCEEISNQPEELDDIVSRCLKSLAYKVLYNESSYSEWWYEDVCTLNLSQFKRLVEYLGAMHHDPVDISNVISYYGNKYNPGLDPNSTGVWIVEERKLLEEMVGLLPPHKGATSTEYLLSMLSAGIMLNANEKCIEKLEKTIGSQLDEAALHNVLASYSKNEQDAISEATNIAHIIYYYVAENLTSSTVKHREWLPF